MSEMGYGNDQGCEGGCAILPTITPSPIVVEYGFPFSTNCSLCGNGTCYEELKWEAPLGTSATFSNLVNGINKTIVQWNVENATEWGMIAMCYGTVEPRSCCTPLPFILYKPPDKVSISFVNHIGPLLEGHHYTLQCRVQDVAPVQNLTVTFYRGDAMLGSEQFSRNTVVKPVTETFTVSINSSREDDGVQYWCEAVLNLGPQGPTPPSMSWSELLTTTVYFKPKMALGSQPDPIYITKGETLQLNCTVHSNPSPAYSWIGPDNFSISNNGVLTIQSAGFKHHGQFVCVASNNQGNTTMKFNVDVSVNPLPIIACLAALFLLIGGLIGGFVYTYHHRHTKTGHYKLKDVFHMNRRNAGRSDAVK
ncbi:unnamed protein product [Lota lota]